MAESGGGSAIYVLNAVLETLQRSDLGATAKLNAIFEAALAHRVAEIAGKLRPDLGETVRGGPFAGMTYSGSATEGCIVPKLLGCYEQELHPTIATAVQQDFEVIINIGCAEGYYAVGLARAMPTASVHAYDTDANARERCRDLAARNGVADRVRIDETIAVDGFGDFEGRRALIVCDIEGAEFALLDPVRAPALVGFDLLVELHPDSVDAADTADTVEAFAGRFTATHDVEVIEPGTRNPGAFPELASLPPLDRTFALIERVGPTPWVYLRSLIPQGGA